MTVMITLATQYHREFDQLGSLPTLTSQYNNEDFPKNSSCHDFVFAPSLTGATIITMSD